MIEIKLKDLVDYTKSSLRVDAADLKISKISTNSKECQGALFIALKGERFDAHDFIADAIAHGAIAIAGHKDIQGLTVPYIKCQDTLSFLGLCGLYVRKHIKALVLSLTGSCGKTSVKEMLASILSLKGRTIYTKGNLNNDIGVPLTLLSLDSECDYAIIEQGASHLHDIERTSALVQSDIALINNIGIAHVEGFGSKENVYHGKREILDEVFTRESGIGIVPSDSPFYERMKLDYKEPYKSGRLLSFGERAESTLVVSDINSEAQSLSFTLSYKGKSIDLKLNLIGKHNAFNAAAAALMALCVNCSLDEVKEGLLNYRGVGSRLHIVQETPFRLIDDCYNASFNSTIAAIDALEHFKGFKVLVFADMLELGSASEEAHKRVGLYAKDRLQALLCYGQEAKVTAKEGQGLYFQSKSDILEYLHKLCAQHQDEELSILVKGSHSMGLHELVEALKQRD